VLTGRCAFAVRSPFSAMRSGPLEANIYPIAKLAQSVFKRENPCKLSVIHDIL